MQEEINALLTILFNNKVTSPKYYMFVEKYEIIEDGPIIILRLFYHTEKAKCCFKDFSVSRTTYNRIKKEYTKCKAVWLA